MLLAAAVPSTSIGVSAAAGCAGERATHEASRVCTPMAGGPVDINAAALGAEAMGGWTVAPRGYDNRAASPIVGAKEGAVGIPSVVGGGGRWHTCS